VPPACILNCFNAGELAFADGLMLGYTGIVEGYIVLAPPMRQHRSGFLFSSTFRESGLSS
jgi:hypothetical protein